MNRRQFLSSMAGSAAAVAARAGKPNILFILADDLGYGDLGCYGQKLIATPNIDKLASEGMRFTQFYCGSTVCAPSRCSLMTGKHTGHARIRGNARVDLLPRMCTIAEVLKAAGYRTGLVGKWGLGNRRAVGSSEPPGIRRVLRPSRSEACAHAISDANVGERGRDLSRRELRSFAQGLRSGPVHKSGADLHREEQGRSILPVPVLHDASCQQ